VTAEAGKAGGLSPETVRAAREQIAEAVAALFAQWSTQRFEQAARRMLHGGPETPDDAR
jgi:hypothetical protein